VILGGAYRDCESVCGGGRLLFPAAVVKMRQRGIFLRANGGKQLITGDSDSAECCGVSGAPVRRRCGSKSGGVESGECVAEQSRERAEKAPVLRRWMVRERQD
jgi:hypothetical protein